MNLLASTLWGGVYLLILFGLCFGGVVGVRLLQQRIRTSKNAPQEQNPTPEKTEKAEKPAQAEKPKPKEVYYIVEKKRSRPKQNYSKPKKINFE